jgi:hypothetical protein
MPLPAVFAALAPYIAQAAPHLLTAGASGLGSYIGSSSSNQNNQMTRGNPGSQRSGDFLTGYGPQTQQLPLFNSEQQQALSKMLSQGMGDFNFPAIEEAARSNFQSKTLPSIAERFASLGSGNRGSSGYGAALGQAGAGFEQQLAALKSQHGLGLLQLGMTPSFQNVHTPADSGLLGAAAPGIGSALTQMSPELISQFVNWLKSYQQQGQVKKEGVA